MSAAQAHLQAVRSFWQLIHPLSAPVPHHASGGTARLNFDNKKVVAHNNKSILATVSNICPVNGLATTARMNELMPMDNWVHLNTWQAYLLLTYSDLFYYSTSYEVSELNTNVTFRIKAFNDYLTKCDQLLPITDQYNRHKVAGARAFLASLTIPHKLQTFGDTIWNDSSRRITLQMLFPNLYRLCAKHKISDDIFREQIWPEISDIAQKVPSAHVNDAQTLKVNQSKQFRLLLFQHARTTKVFPEFMQELCNLDIFIDNIVLYRHNSQKPAPNRSKQQSSAPALGTGWNAHGSASHTPAHSGSRPEDDPSASGGLEDSSSSAPLRMGTGWQSASAASGSSAAYDGSSAAYDGSSAAYDGSSAAYDGSSAAYDGSSAAYDGSSQHNDPMAASGGWGSLLDSSSSAPWPDAPPSFDDITNDNTHGHDGGWPSH